MTFEIETTEHNATADLCDAAADLLEFGPGWTKKLMMSDYPEHDKLSKVAEVSQAQGELLDWLAVKGIHLMHWAGHHEGWVPYGKPLQAILAEFHEIDLAVLEREKAAMLAVLRDGVVEVERQLGIQQSGQSS